jgi:type IX secretion system substrate protein/NHL repeat-containing protein
MKQNLLLTTSIFILPMIACINMELHGQTITTIAGTGVDSYSGDGGSATAATVNRPLEIFKDAAGDIYIADNSNHRIRKIDGATGIISTVAGNGSIGFSGDGGQAFNAQINLPTAICKDPSGNLFISDKSNQRIRKVDALTGIITTIAGNGTGSFSGDGGPATQATISQPHGMQTDLAGNLFFADRTNHRVRRIDATTGIITTIAGDGTSGFGGDGGLATLANLNYPISLCVDDSANVFIADQINHRIRRVDAITGIITTVAGFGTPGFSGDGGLATAAEFNQPYDVAVDSAGNLFISDANNQRIRKVNATTGIVTTIGGTGTGGYGGDGGLATLAQMNFPSGIFVTPSGIIYIGDKLNHRVRKIASCTNTSSSITDTSCISYTSPSGNNTYVTSGIYTDVIPNSAGCDSIITINLTIDTVNTSVSLIAATITSDAVGATYQWLNCDSAFAIIPGETGQSFTALTNGNYAVQVTENGCTDTSACIAILTVGLNSLSLNDVVAIYPNPTSGNLFIENKNNFSNAELSIVDITGRVVYYKKISNRQRINIDLNVKNGIYFVLVQTLDEVVIRKLVVD